MLLSSYTAATRSGIRGYAWEVPIVSRPWGFRLEEMEMEVHRWHGEEDNRAPLAIARYLAQAIPNCQARFLPGEGHLLLLFHWAMVLAALLA